MKPYYNLITFSALLQAGLALPTSEMGSVVAVRSANVPHTYYIPRGSTVRLALLTSPEVILLN
jgi:hypothetical protein